MNILIYIPNLNIHYGGAFQYTEMLLNILSRDKKNTYYIYLKKEIDFINELTQSKANFKLVDHQFLKENKWYYRKLNVVSTINKSAHKTIGRPLLMAKTRIEQIVNHYKIHVVHCPYQQLPATKLSIPCISTMHDVQKLHFPEYFTPEVRAKRAVQYMNVIKHSDAVVVSYDHIKRDIIKYFNKNKKEVHVILLDMSDLWINNVSPDEPIDVISKYDLPENFVLYPASTWPHKGHINLIRSLKLLKEQRTEINLVCTGSKTTHYNEQIAPLISEFEMKDQTRFLGRVSDQELYLLYKLARAVVIPTTYEAGSFPLMEAMFMKTPVICSNVTSLPETIHNKKFVFSPTDKNEMGRLIKSIYNDEEFRKASKKNSEVQIGRLKNKNVLFQILQIYKNVTEKVGLTNN